MKNRENIFESITLAQSNPRPSTSKNCSTEIIIENEGNKSTDTVVDWNDFSGDFEINEQELTAIEQLNQSTAPEKSPAPSFTTGSNRRIFEPCDGQSKLAGHFTAKPPVKVVFKGSEKELPLKKSKTAQDITHTNAPSSQSFPDQEIENTNDITSAFTKNSSVKYEKCVFHGNIINNFYYYKNT